MDVYASLDKGAEISAPSEVAVANATTASPQPALPPAAAADEKTTPTSNEALVQSVVASLASSTTRRDPAANSGDDFVVYDYKPPMAPPKKSQRTTLTEITSSALSPSNATAPAYNASVRIALLDGNWGTLGGPTQDETIDFISTADPSEVAYSENGYIHLRRNIHGENGVVAGLFDSRDKMWTRMAIPLVKDEGITLEVPLMNRASFYRFLDENEMSDYGSFVLVDMADESIEDVDIDAVYGKKITLNSQLETVEPGMSYRFVLFLSVDPGNTTLTYITNQGEAAKAVHLHPDEIFFEAPFVSEAHRREFVIQEHPLLSEERLPVVLHGKRIRYLGLPEPSFMQAHGLYRVAVPPTLRATRQYVSIETSHGEFIVGGNDDILTVPGEKRFDTYQQYLGLDGVEGACIAQFEFGKIPLDIAINSSSPRGPMEFDDYYMAFDGNIYDTFGDFTKTMFLVSGEQGVFSLRISYEDDTVDYLQTFCNHSLYIVENL